MKTFDPLSAADWSPPLFEDDTIYRTAIKAKTLKTLLQHSPTVLRKANIVYVTEGSFFKWYLKGTPPKTPISLDTSGLLPYQIPAVKTLVRAFEHTPFAVNASDAGTGKTYMTLATERHLNRKPGIMCPLGVMETWKRVADYLNVELLFVESYEKLKRYGTPYMDADDKGYPRWHLPKNSSLVFDEAHRCKNPLTINTKTMIAAIWQCIPCTAVSATLAENPLHMKAIGYGLGFHQLGNSWNQFLEENGCRFVYLDRGNQWFFDNDPETLKKLHSKIFPTHGVRVRIKDLGDVFPELQINVEYLTCSEESKIKAAYQEMKGAIDRLREKHESNGSIKADAFGTVARQKAEFYKVADLVQMIKDANEEGQHVAIFVNYNETLDALLEKFDSQCCIRGGQSGEERSHWIDEFQADREPNIFCNLASGGEGVSLHDLNGNFPRLALVIPGREAPKIVQVLRRTHRAKGKTKCQIKFLFAANTEESEVADNMRTKIHNIDTLNDGDLAIRGSIL